jgi:hypothetical protein
MIGQCQLLSRVRTRGGNIVVRGSWPGAVKRNRYIMTSAGTRMFDTLREMQDLGRKGGAACVPRTAFHADTVIAHPCVGVTHQRGIERGGAV